MVDYISREAFLDAIERMKLYHQDADDFAEMLQNFPAADVRPVVMCADCKWFQINMRQDGYLPKGVPECECRHWCGPCDPIDFCSHSEKRGES